MARAVKQEQQAFLREHPGRQRVSPEKFIKDLCDNDHDMEIAVRNVLKSGRY